MLSHSFVNNPSLSKIGDIVRAQRKILGLTQDELAKRCNLSHATIEALENDRIHELGCTKLFKITKTLGLTLGLSEPEINPMEKQ